MMLTHLVHLSQQFFVELRLYICSNVLIHCCSYYQIMYKGTGCLFCPEPLYIILVFVQYHCTGFGNTKKYVLVRTSLSSSFGINRGTSERTWYNLYDWYCSLTVSSIYSDLGSTNVYRNGPDTMYTAGSVRLQYPVYIPIGI